MQRARVEPGGLEAFARAIARGFHEPHRPESLPDLEAVLPLGRTLGFREHGRWVACSGAFPFRLTVPGGELPAAGITAVAVAPTHRRRGLLTAMMDGLLDDAREREEPLAILWASESGIYGRFGFGMSAPTRVSRLRRPYTAFRPDAPAPAGRVVAVDADASAAPRLDAIYGRERARRPGVPARSPALWRHRVFGRELDEPHERRLVVYEGATGDEGYALHRVAEGWDEVAELPDASLTVLELVAVTPHAAAALWRFLLDVDLVERVLAQRRPPDDPLPHLLATPSRLEQRVLWGLWLRVVDVPAALERRTYAVADRLVLEVPGAGVYALEGGPDGAACAPTSATPDLVIPLETLGGVYLGGVAPAALAGAGRLEERTPGAAARLGLMLASPLAAWCPVDF